MMLSRERGSTREAPGIPGREGKGKEKYLRYSTESCPPSPSPCNADCRQGRDCPARPLGASDRDRAGIWLALALNAALWGCLIGLVMLVAGVL